MLIRNWLKYVAITFIFIFSGSEISLAQNKNNYDSLRVLGNLIQRGENDSVRISANRIFQKLVSNLLQQEESVNFDSVKTVSVINAPDKAFTLFTWQLPSYEGSYSFFGFIRSINKKTGKVTVIQLVDSTGRITKPGGAKLTADKWFGAVYYKLVTNKKDGKYFYTLLGWKGNNPLTTQKVIDVLYFTNDKAIFGYPLFKTGRVYKSRMIFEYAAQASMFLGYNEEKKMIVFDHLSSGKKNQNVALVIGPDGTYDGFKFTSGHWEMMEDIDVNAGFTPKSGIEKPLKDEEIRKKDEK